MSELGVQSNVTRQLLPLPFKSKDQDIRYCCCIFISVWLRKLIEQHPVTSLLSDSPAAMNYKFWGVVLAIAAYAFYSPQTDLLDTPLKMRLTLMLIQKLQIAVSRCTELQHKTPSSTCFTFLNLGLAFGCRH